MKHTTLRSISDSSVLNAVYEYWLNKRGDREMPDRRDIDPSEMPRPVLPHIMLLDLLESPNVARYRLIGTAIVERVGSDQTGMLLEDTVSGDYLEYGAEMLREIRECRVSIYAENVFRWNMGGRLVTRRVFLPLTNGGPDVAIVFVGAIFEYSAPIRPTKMILSEARRQETKRFVLVSATEDREGSGD